MSAFVQESDSLSNRDGEKEKIKEGIDRKGLFPNLY
jgi:hypothetical protein